MNIRSRRDGLLAAIAAVGAVLFVAACANPAATDPENGPGTGGAPFLGPAPLVVDYGNWRVVQIDDMLGTGWTETEVPSSPTDGVIGPDGTVWISREFGSEWTVAAFSELSGAELPAPTASSDQVARATAIAVDSQSNIIFVAGQASGAVWSDPHALWSIAYDLGEGTMGDPIAVPDDYLGDDTLYRVSGVHYHDGALFAVVIFDGGAEEDIAVLLKIDVDTGARVEEFEIGTVPSDFNFVAQRYVGDVTVRDSSVYLADSIGAQIIEFDTDLNEIARFGAPYDKESEDPPTDTEFFGPSRFAALPPEEPWFVVIDETKDGWPRESRIVRFSDMNGSDWLAYGEHGSGEDEFWFFDFC